MPLGLLHVEELLATEVTWRWRAGAMPARTRRSTGVVMAATLGTVGLAGQRVRILVPRIRHVVASDVAAADLRGVARPAVALNDLMLKRVLYGISCAQLRQPPRLRFPELDRLLSDSTVSRIVIQSSVRRNCGSSPVAGPLRRSTWWPWSWTARSFAEATLVFALRITLTLEKRFLGFVETDTENEKA